MKQDTFAMIHRHALAALLISGFAFSGAAIAPAETQGEARQRVTRLIDAGVFGKVDPLREHQVDVILEAGDSPLAAVAPIVLVEPGERILLRATLAPGSGIQTRSDLDPTRDVGAFRQTEITEFAWRGESTDRLFEGPDGGVYWRAGESGGRASYVTVEAARLRVDRTAGALGSGEVPAPGALLTGRASVLLLSGVAYDRAGDGLLHGYNLGIYPNEQAANAPQSVRSRAELYRPPTTFFRVDERSRGARVTPTFTLGELAPANFPGDDSAPRFVALSPRVLAFVPALEARLKENNIDPARLAVLRGYVAPTERLRLAQRGESLAEFSRFLYGDALAIVLRQGSGDWDTAPPRMGDLNGDGAIDVGDASVLRDHVKAVMDDLGMFGGLGVYTAFPGSGPGSGTPYVHMDLRGYFVTFGDR